MLETGFAVYILLQHLRDKVPEFRERMQEQERAIGASKAMTRTVRTSAFREQRVVTYSQAMSFFAEHCKRVEIVRHDYLERFYFSTPPMCYHLTASTRDKVKWGVERGGGGKKLQDFFGRHEELLEEMRHQQRLQRFFKRTRVLSMLNSGGRLWKRLSFGLAIIINLLVLTCYQETADGLDVACNDRILDRITPVNWNLVISVLGGFQTLTSTLIVLFFYLNYGPLLWSKGQQRWLSKQRKRREREATKRQQEREQAAQGSKKHGKAGHGGGGHSSGPSGHHDDDGEMTASASAELAANSVSVWEGGVLQVRLCCSMAWLTLCSLLLVFCGLFGGCSKG